MTEAKTAVITGAGRGIGRAIATRWLQEGGRVVLWERDPDSGEDARDELSALGEVHLEVLDVGDPSAVDAALPRTVAWAKSIDVVVNNAVDARTFGTPLEELALADFTRALATNLTAPLHIVQGFLPQLRAARGAVVNIVSTRAFMSEPNTFAYTASKGGLAALTHSLAISLGPEIRVNAVAPGWIDTSAFAVRGQRTAPALSERDHAQHPVGRVGRPEDVAAAVTYLCSSEAGFVTGQVLTVDGGMTRKMIYEE